MQGWIPDPWLALALPCLAAWSYVAGQQPETDAALRYAWTLLALSALVRLPARAVPAIGRPAGALDRYALATLAGLRRKPALPPAPAALLFTLALPAERVLQRLLGLVLQIGH